MLTQRVTIADQKDRGGRHRWKRKRICFMKMVEDNNHHIRNRVKSWAVTQGDTAVRRKIFGGKELSKKINSTGGKRKGAKIS